MRRGGVGASLLLLGLALCATKDWPIIEWLRIALCRTELACAPSLFQFQSQLGAIAIYAGVLCCPFVWPVLQSPLCRRLGRLSFSIYLLHFPILFTLVCLVFVTLPSVAFSFLLFIALTLFAAVPFERWIDRPAIALSRRVIASSSLWRKRNIRTAR